MNNNSPLPIDTFLPFMRDVVRCEQSLHELNLMWRMIEASARMNCPSEARTILPTMAATRAGFNRLEQELVSSLVREKVGNVLDEIGTKSQYVIDIVVRNLYERTADVGFLATDGELCAFAAGLQEDADAIRLRLRAYRSKYTVYDEIILLDLEGNVLVQIDEASPVEGSTDPLLQQTLAAPGYVETFRKTDLRPGKDQALVYSRRMLHPETGAPVGVLCLCFNFEEEMAGIFRSHGDADGRANMLLLDGANRVIASADPRWIPPGATVPVNRSSEPKLLVYGGREYLVRTFAAEGYQGYMGPPGWQGQVMVALDVAFHGGSRRPLAALDPEVADGLLSHARSFCPPLFEIMTAAETIRRVVWNGQVMTAGRHGELARLKAILEQIGETGDRSNDLFSHSIRDLYETVLDSRLRDAEFVSRLLVDLLDRNLYERANDCRWWALAPELRAALSMPGRDPETLQRLGPMLAYVNGLYTVYTSLFIYDEEGRIQAASDRDGGHGKGALATAAGARIEPATLAAVLALKSEQDYYVTPFADSPWYGGRPTYVYHAAVRDPDNPKRVVGGIGIVFDSGPEFHAMLASGLAGKEEASALFIDREARIVSGTDPARPIGSMLEIDPDLLSLPKGCSASRIVVHDGYYAVMGVSVCSGYREFKVRDGYCDDVLAVVFYRFGPVRTGGRTIDRDSTMLAPALAGGGVEYATFFVDGMLFAIPAAAIGGALPASEVAPISMGGRRERIGVLAQQREGEDRHFVWVFDLRYLMFGTPSMFDGRSQVVIVRHAGQDVGLLVDELHAVPEFLPDQIRHTPFADGARGQLVSHVIQANDGRLMIQGLDVGHLFACLKDPSLPTRMDDAWLERASEGAPEPDRMERAA